MSRFPYPICIKDLEFAHIVSKERQSTRGWRTVRLTRSAPATGEIAVSLHPALTTLVPGRLYRCQAVSHIHHTIPAISLGLLSLMSHILTLKLDCTKISLVFPTHQSMTGLQRQMPDYISKQRQELQYMRGMNVKVKLPSQ